MNTDEIYELLKTVMHPVREADIVSLEMVEDLKIEEGKIRMKLVFPSPDALSSQIKKSIEHTLKKAMGEDTHISIIELVRERKVQKRSHPELGQEQLEHVGRIIAVASGKGGVGKSTVAVNLAVALAGKGYRVGLADADVYGPSVPKMTGTEDARPQVDTSDGRELIIPVEKYGVKWMSIGYFSRPEQPLIWRGPMASNALKQIVLQVKWGKLDYLLIDLPPGTGDIHISIVHDLPLSGAVVVSTPQAVALADVEKGINMFRAKEIEKPVLGLIENMAWFTPEELPDNKYYIFGKEGCKKLAQEYNLPLLAQIPIVQSIREDGDNGSPAALKSTRADGIAFGKLADKIIEEKIK